MNELREPVVAYGKKKFTIEEYLAFESASAQKHEYYKGEIFLMEGHKDMLAMSGAGSRHNKIFTNLFGNIFSQLKGKPCPPYGSDMRVHIPENTLFTYPDISIFCGDIIPSDEDKDSVIQPVAVIEILSPPTRNYDRGDKFTLYRDIPTLQDYLLVDSQAVRVEAYNINTDGYWELHDYKEMEDIVFVGSAGLSLSLREIYNETKLSDK